VNTPQENGGLRCGEVLADLSAYCDGELSGSRRAAIEAHVRACPDCARFGGAFAATLRALREQLSAPADVPADVAARLAAALRRSRTG
jgi:anti-sigma factor RsiW